MDSSDEFLAEVNSMIQLREKKNHDYGDGFIESYNKYGKQALFFDLLRKWTRIEKILLKDNELKVADETVEDTLMDLAAMSLNGIVWLKRSKKCQKHLKKE